MDEKTKDIATISLEEWKEFVNQLLEGYYDQMAEILCFIGEPPDSEVNKAIDLIGSAVFGQVLGNISLKLFPDIGATLNEKGELQWRKNRSTSRS